MKYGVFYVYWEKDWTGDYYKYIRKAYDIGLDVLEISAGSLLDMSDDEVRKLGELARELNIEISCNVGAKKENSVASINPDYKKAGIDYEFAIMDKMVILGSKMLVGVMNSYWPYDFVDLDRDAVWRRSVEGMKILGEYAEKLGITLSIEVLNRFESLIINTAEEGVKFVEEVGSPAVSLLLDTFHMNIEEDYIPDAIRTAGKYISHVHVGERNRRLPCDRKGSLNWKEIGAALKEVGYNGYVIAEPFVTIGGQIAKDVKIWRDLSSNATEEMLDQAAKEYYKFIKESFEG